MSNFDYEYGAKLLNDGNFDKLTEYLDKFQETSETLILSGSMSLLQNDYQIAVKNLLKAVTLDDTNSVAWNNLGLAYYNTGELPEAIKAFDKSLDIDPQFVEAMMNVGTCYLATNQFDDAQKSFEGAIKLNPEHSGIWSNLGLVYLNQQEYGNAKICFLRSLKIDPSENAYYNIGLVEKNTGNFKAAKNYFQKSLALNNSNPVVLYSLADIYYILEDYPASKLHIKSVLEFQKLPKDLLVEILVLKGKLFCYSNQEIAIDAFKQAINLDPSLNNYLDFIDCLQNIDIEESLLIIEEASQNYHNQKQLLYINALLKVKLFEETFKTSLLTEAIELFEKVLEIEQISDVIFNIGACYQRIGNYSKAEEYFEKAISLDPKLRNQVNLDEE